MPLLRYLLIFATLWQTAVGHAETLFPTNSFWKYLIGTREASQPMEDWRYLGFDDSTWNSAYAAFGYGDPAARTVFPSTASGRYTSVFFRKAFGVAAPDLVTNVTLNIRVDDGFIVWINGNEVGRYNVGTNDIFLFTTNAASSIETTLRTITLTSNLTSILSSGDNMLAVQVFNYDPVADVDLFFDASMTVSGNNGGPYLTSINPPIEAVVNSLTQIEVTFNETVLNVDAANFMINNNPATSVTAVSGAQYRFSFTQPTNGLVQVGWGPYHGITDVSLNPFQGGTWTYTLNTNANVTNVVINEFLAANKKNLRDENGDYSDWIEIFNAGAVPVPLGGWYLTDEATNLTKWMFPPITLASRAYLVVFASGKNRTNNLAWLHTNFQLEKNGEYLALVNPATNVVSQFSPAFPVQSSDVAYGLARGDLARAGYFSLPTPGGANAVNGTGFAPDVFFSRSSCTFTQNFSLQLTTTDTNAIIRYELGTNAPTDLSTRYTAPITISQSTRVRARCFKTGLLPGELHSMDYIRLDADTNVTRFVSEIPIVVLYNYQVQPYETNGDFFTAIQIFEPKNGRSALTNVPDLSVSGSYHQRGKSTFNFPKKSLFLETQDEFGDDFHVKFAGMPEQSDWVLYAINQYDKVLIHNPVAHELYRQMGNYTPRTRMVEVFLAVGLNDPPNNTLTASNYYGLFVLEEKIKVGKNRVDIDRLAPEQTNAATISGGYLFSIDVGVPNPIPIGGMNVNFIDPDYYDIVTAERARQKLYAGAYLSNFFNALYSPDWKNPTNGYRAYIDMPSWLDYHIHNVLTFNVDALRLSAYFHKPREGKLVQGPLWDFDRTQGSSDNRAFNPRLWRSGAPSDRGTDMFAGNYIIATNLTTWFTNSWYGKMFQDIDFWQGWIDRYQELRRDVYLTTNVLAVIDGLAGPLSNAQKREVNLWRGSGTSDTSPRSGLVTVTGYSNTFDGTFRGEVDFLKNWWSNRLGFIDSEFVTWPSLSRGAGAITNGFPLSITAPAGVIYYTLDGTDPRTPGGGTSSVAQAYSGPLVLTNNARVVARAFDVTHTNQTGTNCPQLSSSWSSPLAATYVLRTPPLVVTEIMFHPQNPPVGITNAADDFEYIELKNTGTAALSLAGFRFTNGIFFDFTTSSIPVLAAGEYVLLVRNRAAFQTRYPGVTNIAGEYGGSLGNSGERLVLEGPLREPIHDFSVADNWFRMADGNGFSYVIQNENAVLSSWTNQASWRLSSSENGSPGQADLAPPVIQPILVNELLASGNLGELDAVELYNPNTNAVDLASWFLSDDFGAPKKFRFSTNTVIPAGGYLVVDENLFNPGDLGFAFGANGDSVYLFSGDAQTNLTGYYHGFAFDASAVGSTLGRYVNTLGEEYFVRQLMRTLGTNNAGPIIGPLVFTEIHANPTNGGDPFVELLNISTNAVAFYDVAYPSNTWKVDGVAFDFPTNTIVAPLQTVLVIATNTTNFRSRYSVSSNVLVFGPWLGILQTNGETLRLQMPGLPGSNGVPYVTVDEVRYDIASPWPTNTLGSGASLQSTRPDLFGNDAALWRAANITPGTVPPWFTQSPLDLTNTAGASVMFSGLALASPAPIYQWLFDGVQIANATNPVLTLTNVTCPVAGQYRLVASNVAGVVTSAVATLTIPGLAQPDVLQSPQSLAADVGSNATFAVIPTASCYPLGFQWYWNNTSQIINATSPVLNLTNLALGNGGTYRVLISNAAGMATSLPAALTVNLRMAGAQHLGGTSGFTFSLPAETGRIYTLQYKSNLVDTNWSILRMRSNVNGTLSLSDPDANTNQARYYRMKVE
jgi:hypothetical protein